MDSESFSQGTTLTAGDTEFFSHAHSVSKSESRSHSFSRGIREAIARTISYMHGPLWDEPFISRRMLARVDERIRASIAGRGVENGTMVEGEVMPGPATLLIPAHPEPADAQPINDDEDRQPGRIWRESDPDA